MPDTRSDGSAVCELASWTHKHTALQGEGAPTPGRAFLSAYGAAQGSHGEAHSRLPQSIRCSVLHQTGPSRSQAGPCGMPDSYGPAGNVVTRPSLSVQDQKHQSRCMGGLRVPCAWSTVPPVGVLPTTLLHAKLFPASAHSQLIALARLLFDICRGATRDGARCMTAASLGEERQSTRWACPGGAPPARGAGREMAGELSPDVQGTVEGAELHTWPRSMAAAAAAANKSHAAFLGAARARCAWKNEGHGGLCPGVVNAVLCRLQMGHPPPWNRRKKTEAKSLLRPSPPHRTRCPRRSWLEISSLDMPAKCHDEGHACKAGGSLHGTWRPVAFSPQHQSPSRGLAAGQRHQEKALSRGHRDGAGGLPGSCWAQTCPRASEPGPAPGCACRLSRRARGTG